MSTSATPERRLRSPTSDSRSPKRRKSAPALLDVDDANQIEMPEPIHDIISKGDVLLLFGSVGDSKGQCALRGSSAALSLASTVFKEKLDEGALTGPPATDGSPPSKCIEIDQEDDGHAVLRCVNILHFRHDTLPARLSPDELLSLARVASKYKCVASISSSTVLWFDSIYRADRAADVPKMILASYLLDEPEYFERFTTRWVIREKLGSGLIVQVLPEEYEKMHWISDLLQHFQAKAFRVLRLDADLLVGPVYHALAKASQHFIGFAPGVDPEPGELSPGVDPVNCAVDEQGAPLYFAALRDGRILPATLWGDSAASVIDAFRNLQVPEYDDCDRCEGCIPLVDVFADRLSSLRKAHKERLWGLCLDCFNAGGINHGKCRVDHGKQIPQQQQQQQQRSQQSHWPQHQQHEPQQQ